MQKKVDEKKIKEIPPFKIFEAIFLDNETDCLMCDFDGFLNALKLYRWNQEAFSNLNKLKN